MFKFVTGKKEMLVSQPEAEARKMFIRCLELTGKVDSSAAQSDGTYQIKGSMQYGMQSVPIIANLSSNGSAQTSVSVTAKCDDFQGKAATNALQRLTDLFSALKSGDSSAVDEILRTECFKNSSAVSGKKIILMAGAVVVVAAVVSALVTRFLLN